MVRKKYCNRCAHEMWYSEKDKRWYCTNSKCVKYKAAPEHELTPKQGQIEELL